MIDRSEASDEDRVNCGDASVRCCNNFAGAELVADCLENECHTKARLEAEVPIFGVGLTNSREFFADFLAGLLVIHKMIIAQVACGV